MNRKANIVIGTAKLLLCGAGLLGALTRAQAATLYVDAASTNAVPPFTNWASAAVTIQDAVDAAAPGDEIVVTNGVYQIGARAVYGTSNRVAVTKSVTVRSVNGPDVTIIQGAGPLGETAIRCVYLTNGAVLAGFTLTNGAAQVSDDTDNDSITNSGGGVFCASQSAVVTNCVLAGNSAYYGGGAYSGTLNNCTITGNRAWEVGGGAEWSTLNNCMVTSNSAAEYGGGGAAVSTLNNCTLMGNSAPYGGGAVSSTLNNCMVTGNWVSGEFATGGGVDGGTLNNCTLTGNRADVGGGAFYATLNNCMITGNSADGCGGTCGGTLNNCTVTGNSAGASGGVFAGTLNNCIVYFNFADNDPNWSQNEFYSITLNNSCTTPAPGSGVGNITNAPLFVDTNGWSNLRLQSNSPCINAGNNSYLTNSNFTNYFDLDGLPRIVGGTVDIGAFEWQGTHFVSAASTNPIAPYISWATAAAVLQDAVDVAQAGETVLVTNGLYAVGGRVLLGNLTNRVVVDRPIMVQSVNGPEVTVIRGFLAPSDESGESSIRCVYLSDGAVLSGFTLTNGATRWEASRDGAGGGILCESTNAVITNCTLTGNNAFEGGGVWGGTLHDCTITFNQSDGGGGASGAILHHCTLDQNRTAGAGGGAYNSTLGYCTLTGNQADRTGGGVALSTLNRCTLTGNLGLEAGGGAAQSTLNHCTLVANQSFDSGGGGGAWYSTLNVCTLTGNSADPGSGGGAEASTLNNCALTNNRANGGGGAHGSALNNCTLTGNSATSASSDSSRGGGAAASTLTNCTLTGNSAEGRAGGAESSTLVNCMITGNAAGAGGGAAGSTLIHCMVMGNWAFEGGGGAYVSTLNNCTVVDNLAAFGGGVALSTLTNCLITDNSAWDWYGGGAFVANLNNCTLTGNSSSFGGGGAFAGTLNNCIVLFNFADNAPNWGQNEFFPITLNYSCTTPAPESGVGNITNAPLFVDTNGWSNLRLQSNSPCINAGNNSYLTNSNFTNYFDLDGLPRIAGGTVDIGAYEFQSPASTISYAWLQQFGLPTDGTADYVDTDHDGHNNWQEWMAGTDPTNALSMLRLAPPVITRTNVILTWTSVTNRTYTLEQATNLGGAPAFSVLRSNLAGLPGTTSWTDTNAPVSSPRFYQLRVSP